MPLYRIVAFHAARAIDMTFALHGRSQGSALRRLRDAGWIIIDAQEIGRRQGKPGKKGEKYWTPFQVKGR